MSTSVAQQLGAGVSVPTAAHHQQQAQLQEVIHPAGLGPPGLNSSFPRLRPLN